MTNKIEDYEGALKAIRPLDFTKTSLEYHVEAIRSALELARKVQSGECVVVPFKHPVSSAMKAECIGEFSFEIDETCSACYFDEAQSNCEVCAGEIHYKRSVMVPWDLTKKIYKEMLIAAQTGERE